MSQQNSEKSGLPDYPRAPISDFDDNVLMQRPAPPSYDESLKQNAHQQPMPQAQFQSPQYQAAGQPYAYPPPQPNAPQGYAGAPQYVQYGYGQAYAMPPSQHPPVLTLAQGAEIRTNSSGAVSVPPPPPGYAPTPAQWAAMQGQQVMVKEPKKRSFFS